MARQRLQLQVVHQQGVQPLYSTPTADGFLLSNDGRVLLLVLNQSNANLVLTLGTPGTFDGTLVAGHPVSIAAGTAAMIGNLRPSVYNQPHSAANAAHVYLDFSVVTNIFVAALYAGRATDTLSGLVSGTVAAANIYGAGMYGTMTYTTTNVYDSATYGAAGYA